MSCGHKQSPRQIHDPGRTLDPYLIMAACAPDSAERKRLLEKVAQMFGLHVRTIYKRMQHIGVKRSVSWAGPAALAAWEQRMRGIAQAYSSHQELLARITQRADQMREYFRQRAEERLGADEARKLLHVSRKVFTRYEAMGLIAHDEQGLFPLPVIREFILKYGYVLHGYKQAQHRRKKGSERRGTVELMGANE